MVWKTDDFPYDGSAISGGVASPIEIKQQTLSFPFADTLPNQHAGLIA